VIGSTITDLLILPGFFRGFGFKHSRNVGLIQLEFRIYVPYGTSGIALWLGFVLLLRTSFYILVAHLQLLYFLPSANLDSTAV
jgi:hypothetical protein